LEGGELHTYEKELRNGGGSSLKAGNWKKKAGGRLKTCREGEGKKENCQRAPSRRFLHQIAGKAAKIGYKEK